jgi:hypothetical protein
VDERTPRAAIPVGERMNRLELGMSDRGLRDRRQIVGIAEVAEIFEQLRDILGRWRDECRIERVELAPADPVLEV